MSPRDVRELKEGGSHRFDNSHELFPDTSKEEFGEELKVAREVAGEGLLRVGGLLRAGRARSAQQCDSTCEVQRIFNSPCFAQRTLSDSCICNRLHFAHTPHSFLSLLFFNSTELYLLTRCPFTPCSMPLSCTLKPNSISRSPFLHNPRSRGGFRS